MTISARLPVGDIVAKHHLPAALHMPDGGVYRAVLMRIQSRYENEAPEDLTYIPEDLTVELSEDQSQNCFVVVYVNAKTFKMGA